MISPTVKTLSLIAVTACLLSSSLPLLHARSTGNEREIPYEEQGGTYTAKIGHSYRQSSARGRKLVAKHNPTFFSTTGLDQN
jgi:hypothetical protein